MKTFLRTSLAVGLLCTALAPARAQAVSNGGFETWAARNGVDAPTNWLTSDDVLLAAIGLPIPTGTYTKVTDVHGGTYAVRLESKTVSFVGGVPGSVSLGTKVNTKSDLPGGGPFTSRPATLQFYYKLAGPQAPVASDGAFAQVLLTRNVNGTSQTIATGRQVFSTLTSTYVLGQVPLTYTSSATPDSVRLVFGTSAATTAGTATPGTVFHIDDVAFTGTVAATRNAALSAALTASPNPSPDGRYVLSAAPALLAAPLTVTDATGRVVRREAAPAVGPATRPLDLTGLAGGVYTLQLFADQGLITKKLLVQ